MTVLAGGSAATGHPAVASCGRAVGSASRDAARLLPRPVRSLVQDSQSMGHVFLQLLRGEASKSRFVDVPD
ncbi:MAG TPA: hypothetical protein VM899_03455 [Rubellimicrobium sp.]|nr:hypothetical protein [Rubellimicrobium sp.]